MKDKENFETTIYIRRIETGRRTARAPRAIKAIREEVIRHTGATKVIVDPLLANLVSRKGRDVCPSKVSIIASKVSEKTYIVKPALKVRA
jgi:large subunit ribosomal protein L31e